MELIHIARFASEAQASLVFRRPLPILDGHEWLLTHAAVELANTSVDSPWDGHREESRNNIHSYPNRLLESDSCLDVVILKTARSPYEDA